MGSFCVADAEGAYALVEVKFFSEIQRDNSQFPCGRARHGDKNIPGMYSKVGSFAKLVAGNTSDVGEVDSASDEIRNSDDGVSLVRKIFRLEGITTHQFHNFSEFNLRPAFRIDGRIAEEVEEEGLGEGVELGEGGAALGPQRLRPVQHLRDPPLLRQRRQGDFESGQFSRVESRQIRSSRTCIGMADHCWLTQEIAKKASIQIRAWQNGENIRTANTVEIRTGYFSQIRPEFSVKNMSLRELEFRTGKLAFAHRFRAKNLSAAFDVFETEICGSFNNGARLNRISFNRGDISESCNRPASH